MQSMAWLIDRHHFHVTIDGHTREGLALPRPEYSAWELSSDRANAARRKLVYYAVEPQLIERVTGYADTKPLAGEPPASESNQRITLSLALVRSGQDKEKDKSKAVRAAPVSRPGGSRRPQNSPCPMKPAPLPPRSNPKATLLPAPAESLRDSRFPLSPMKPFLSGKRTLEDSALRAPHVHRAVALTGAVRAPAPESPQVEGGEAGRQDHAPCGDLQLRWGKIESGKCLYPGGG